MAFPAVHFNRVLRNFNTLRLGRLPGLAAREDQGDPAELDTVLFEPIPDADVPRVGEGLDPLADGTRVHGVEFREVAVTRAARAVFFGKGRKFHVEQFRAGKDGSVVPDGGGGNGPEAG